MNKIAVYGHIISGNNEIVATVLRNWLSADNLDIKIRLSGEEIVYEDEIIYLYCYNTNLEEKPSFLLEGNVSDTLDNVKILLQKLLQLFREQNIVSSFECVEVDEDDNEVSEELSVQ